ncbi:MAG: dTMP kinase [Bacteroidales bacterium]|jgi:dTMP kinase|nr:dTMP kinase [Bacteroidales bacterium]MCI1785161.1 dTMP kinase [Bacteroidales bacterium]
MLIVLEGLDGSGKSTQVALLKNYMETISGKVEYIHFPRYDSPVYGELISKFLRGDFGAINEVNPQLVALLYAEDRHNAAPLIRKYLNGGDTLLLDRYVYSNVAYQCAKIQDTGEKERLRRWITDTEFIQFGIPRPDLNIFLDVPISFISEKLVKRTQNIDRHYLKGKTDIHESDMDFQKKVRNVYLEQCRSDKRFIRVDCSDENGRMLPAGIIFEKIKIIANKAIEETDTSSEF